MKQAEWNIDTFGEIMDSFLKDNHIQMLIDMPEGKIKPEVKDNANMGGTVQFYIMLNALTVTMNRMFADMKGMLDPKKKEPLIDGILKIVKNELMEGTGIE